MGRHTAEITIPSAEDIAADRERRLASSAPHFSERTPVTDPSIFDARPVAAASARGAQPATSVLPIAEPAPRPVAPRTVAPQRTPEVAADERVLRNLRTIAPRPVAPQVPQREVLYPPVRPVPTFTSGPLAPTPTPRLAPADLTAVAPTYTAPSTGSASTRADAFRPKRSLSLAVCAMALLGAVGGATVLVPNEGVLETAGHVSKHRSGTTTTATGAATVAAKTTPRNAHGKAVSAAAHQRNALRQQSRHAAHPTPTGTPTPIATSVGPTVTPLRQFATPTPKPVSTAAPTPIPSRTPTNTPTPADTATPASTAVPTARPTASAAPTATSRPTPAPTQSTTPAPTRTASFKSAVAGAANGAVVALSAGIYSFDDFASSMIGVDLSGTRGIDGAGVSSTIIQMRPHTSTRAGSVPHTAWKTNPLYLLRFGGSPVLKDFTLRATAQGHLYNGMKLRGTTNARITNVRVEGVPGNDDIPPGETFGINDANTHGSVYDGVTVDGKNLGASGFGSNSAADVTIRNSSFYGNSYGNGATFWQTKNVTVSNTRSSDNKDFAFNFERVSGTVKITNAIMRNNRQGDLRFASDQGSAKVTIVDPVFSGSKLKIKVNRNYLGTTNKQRLSDIRVIINGVDKTSSVVEWIR